MDAYIKEKKKNVTFNLNKNQIRILYEYDSFVNDYRSGATWIQMSIDNERFHKRITDTANVLNHVLDLSHRLHIYNERFKKL